MATFFDILTIFVPKSPKKRMKQTLFSMILVALLTTACSSGTTPSASEITAYKESLLSDGLDARFDNRNIVLRDISAVGTPRELESYLSSGEEFMMVPTNSFSLENEHIRIKELYGDEVCVPALSVDSMIFGVIGKKINSERFCIAAEDCLDDSFPMGKKRDFIKFLWKRISLLMSYGLLLPIKSKL